MSRMQTRHSPKPSLVVLKNQAVSLDAELQAILNVPIDRMKDSPSDLRDIGNDCKSIFSALSNVVFKLILYEVEQSADSASKLRSKLRDTKKEVAAFIVIINSYLNSDALDNITFDSNSTISGSIMEHPVDGFAPELSSTPVNTHSPVETVTVTNASNVTQTQTVTESVDVDHCTYTKPRLDTRLFSDTGPRSLEIQIPGSSDPNQNDVISIPEPPPSTTVGSQVDQFSLRDTTDNPNPREIFFTPAVGNSAIPNTAKVSFNPKVSVSALNLDRSSFDLSILDPPASKFSLLSKTEKFSYPQDFFSRHTLNAESVASQVPSSSNVQSSATSRFCSYSSKAESSLTYTFADAPVSILRRPVVPSSGFKMEIGPPEASGVSTYSIKRPVASHDAISYAAPPNFVSSAPTFGLVRPAPTYYSISNSTPQNLLSQATF